MQATAFDGSENHFRALSKVWSGPLSMPAGEQMPLGGALGLALMQKDDAISAQLFGSSLLNTINRI
jgi:hypothetical protein